MKKLLFYTILLLTPFVQLKAQTFSAAFDPWDGKLSDGEGFAYASNVNGTLSASENPLLGSYLNMYKATKDIHFLEKFVVQATRMMERRDDYLGNSAGDCVYPYYTSLSLSGSETPNQYFGFPSTKCSYVPDISGLVAEQENVIGRSFSWSNAGIINGNCDYFYQASFQ